MELHSVREMYRHFSVRDVCGDTCAVDVRTGVPSGLPDDETDGRQFVFVHGYNVDPDAAREWSDAMFKRLLLAGSQSMFTSVTWFGDYAQVWDGVPVVGGELAQLLPQRAARIPHPHTAQRARRNRRGVLRQDLPQPAFA